MMKMVVGMAIGVVMGGALGAGAQVVTVGGGIKGGAVVGNSVTLGTLNTGTTLQVSGGESGDGR